MTRKDARKYCFKLLFEYEVQKKEVSEMMQFFAENQLELKNQEQYVTALLTATTEHIAEIDSLIEQNTKGWKLGRLPKVTLAVLRLAVGEMLYMDDIPDSISINEAVELAKAYNDEKNGKFVNGVLSSVLKGK